MKRMSYVLTLLVTLGYSPLALAQDKPFITSLNTADLTPAQSKALDDIRQLPTTQESTIVRADAAALMQNAQVEIPLPGRGAVTVATSDRSVLSDRAFVLAGRTESNDSVAVGDGSVGLSTFSVNGDSVTGSIQTETGLFRIRPLGGGAHVLFKVGTFPSEHPSNEPLNGGGDRQDLPPLKLKSMQDRGLTEITVLVAFTPAVANLVPDIQGLVDLAFVETNTSYANSGVYIKVVPATPKPVSTNYQESGSFDTDLAALKNKSDGKMDELQTLRDQIRADVVVLLINNGSSCGLASDILGSKESAFAVVYYDCATGNYSFGHEIGHIQGARHNPEVDPTPSPFAYGHGFMDATRNRRSVMSYDCPNHCTRLPQWARPDEWGNSDVSNDARVLNETRDMIASFR